MSRTQGDKYLNSLKKRYAKASKKERGQILDEYVQTTGCHRKYAAVVLDELAIITRPGADSRRPETASIARAPEPYRKLCAIQAPGTVDGGDVLCVGKTVYIGLSSRSNPAAIEQMESLLRPCGYTLKGAPVNGCLHLKSAVTQVAQDTLLINRNWVEAGIFGDMNLIEVDAAEPCGANTLLVGQTAIYPASFPRTRKRLEERAIPLMTVDVSELAKAEGAVTCCSLLFQVKVRACDARTRRSCPPKTRTRSKSKCS